MSEAYECDRCGGLNSGTPDTDLQVAEGTPRFSTRDEYHAHHEQREGGVIQGASFDLCQACRNDLRRWFREGGTTVSFPHEDDAELAGDGDA